MPKTESRENIVNVREGAAGSSDPMSAEFVRQGLIAIQAVNRGLNRMQAELAYLVNSTAGRPTQQAGFPYVPYTPSATPYAPFAYTGNPWGFASPWSTGAFTPAAVPGASYGGFGLPPNPIATSNVPFSPGTAVGFNPQPDPPGRFTNVALNPQPPQSSPWASFQGQAPMGVPQAPGFRVPIASAFGAGFGAGVPQGFTPGLQAGFPASPGLAVQTGFTTSPGLLPQAAQAGFGSYLGAPSLLGGPDTLAFGETGLTPQLFRHAQDLQNAPPVGRVPNVDLIDEGSEYLVRVEIPGVQPEKLELTCYPNGIVVTARSDTELPDGTLLLAESGRVAFRRAIELPSEIKTHESKATLQDGILTVHLAKQVPTEGPRQVDVAYR